ncbi:general secretion pathway protein GspD [Shewanella sp. Scap07]|nr:general secretion pathway protein GspD [Shewanella sp. Scap07]
MGVFAMRKNFCLSIIAAAVLSGCSTLPTEPYPYDTSYLEGEATEKEQNVDYQQGLNEPDIDQPSISYKKLPSMKTDRTANTTELDLTKQFSDTEKVTISADALPLNQFLHYVLGEVLEVSYILDNNSKADSKGVTLNIRKPITKRKLFTLVDELLVDGGYQLYFKDDLFYVNKQDQQGSSNRIFGFGRELTDVPRTSVDITQIVPLNFPLKSGFHLTIQQLANVQVGVDYDQNSVTLTGRRPEILKAMEFIHLVDAPLFRDRQVTLYRSTFVPADELAENLSNVLNNEGITVKGDKPSGNAVTVLPIERISSVILFANDYSLLKRAGFWLSKLDQPSMIEENQYFTYIPQFARASDIAESLEPLLSGTSANRRESVNNTVGETSAQTKGKPNQSSGAIGNDKVKLVVDVRSNALIAQTTGLEYQRLLPLIKRMDVMPKQVMLEVMIAEVTLTDVFKQGVEFAFSSGDLSISTKGSFGVEKIGGMSFGLKGADGEILANFLETNSHVNVLSRPSVVVRDGASAAMNVGTDIPVVGETTSDPDGDRQTTSIQYRKTGVQLTVTPTVNSQGVVIMEINQSISNQANTETVSDSPAIFERMINTEVVANSGQAVILGGLISENSSYSESKVPWLGDLPLLGGLFRSNNDEVVKTELIVMVTPRIIEASNEWDDIKSSFTSQMQALDPRSIVNGEPTSMTKLESSATEKPITVEMNN